AAGDPAFSCLIQNPLSPVRPRPLAWYRGERDRRLEGYGVQEAGKPRTPVQPGLVVHVGEGVRDEHPFLVGGGLGERPVPRPVRREPPEHGDRKPYPVQFDAVLHDHPLRYFDAAVCSLLVPAAGHCPLHAGPAGAVNCCLPYCHLSAAEPSRSSRGTTWIRARCATPRGSSPAPPPRTPPGRRSPPPR